MPKAKPLNNEYIKMVINVIEKVCRKNDKIKTTDVFVNKE